MLKSILLLCFSAAMLALPFWLQKGHGHFHVGKVAIDLPFDPAWSSDPPSSEVCSVLAGPFAYLGHGAQAFVFESKDGQFVLKLFRGTPKRHPWIRKRERKSVAQKIPPLFAACKLAYEKARGLTGLVYIHLNSTDGLLPVNRSLGLDLNQCRFVLQRKGQPIRDVFRDAIEKKDLDKSIRLAKSVVALLKERTSKKIGNLDKTLWYNFGFVGETAIEWDFGRYYHNPNLDQMREMRIFTQSLQTFLEEKAPEWSINLEELF